MMRPEIKKKCPECGGSGEASDNQRDYMAGERYPCSNCSGAGEVWNHLTPEQWEQQTGEKMLDSDPMWIGGKKKPFLLIHYGASLVRADLGEHIVVSRPGQPPPPEGYRL